ncbi:hypothetical protein DP113_33715 (plasmid) [Brasilonema octagenarum UFV-E1]|uniref:Uncharacterized protein n=2 Tax=Brasilonema TaxID=383614 RepID=A0A856MSS7_9CYAN|nr:MULTISPECIES: hypothetical protein [Brasilonema]NMF65330.1 hypothetical protein [Brasilonema octagenarum UFV-OR1]QDL12687.1 hypothetical protein DP114_33610 [Brasilonema sennae CENA114]QDL19081.1 hypothetical protein DP113_33715 [Brasilonema octagenarum UFV-E1]
METKDLLTDNSRFKVINITTETVQPQTSAIQVNSEIVAIVPVTTTNDNPPKNELSKGYQWREQKMNTWRYLMVAGMVAGLALHGLIRFGGNYNIGSLVFGDKAVAATPTNVSNLREVAGGILPPANFGNTSANLWSNDSNLNHSTKQAKTLKKQPLAVKYVNGVPVPDWSKINFDSMKFSSAGEVEFPNIKDLKLKGKRVWSAGQSLAEVMQLGDFEATEFKIENLNLTQISRITGTSLKNLKLSDFETFKWQSLGDLASAIPELSKLEVADIPAIDDLVTKVTGDATSSLTIGEALESYPKLETAELGKYLKLDKYKLTSIPGIEKAALKKFNNWENTIIGKVPGLGKVPFDQLPGVPVPDLSYIGKVDMVLKEVENGRWKSISGSEQEGFNVPCYNKKCAHIEVAGSDILTGAAWMSGKFQKVKGGFGILGSVNVGKEPTGRHPFGKSFKQVIWDVNEADGSITTAMFFRFCKTIPFVGRTCTPYFIGPVPFFNYSEMDPIILGTPLTVPKKPTP